MALGASARMIATIHTIALLDLPLVAYLARPRRPDRPRFLVASARVAIVVLG
jgi:hypothetical protein